MRLILAEDSALLREGLARALTARGIEVTGEAADPSSLIKLVDLHQPDVVLLDLRMPPTFTDEGLQAAEQIRAAHPGVAVLLLSQYTDIALAARLYLSPKTVERNVAAVFDKLGLPADSDDNRRVLAVIAYLRAPA